MRGIISNKQKKGQIVTALQGIGLGIVSLAIILGVGLVVMNKFNTSLAVCPDANLPYNESQATCYNSSDGVTGNADPTNT